MPDRLQEIRARLDAATTVSEWQRTMTLYPSEYGDRRAQKRFIAHAPADIAWLLDEVERLRDKMDRNFPWWRRDSDGSLWAAPPTPDGAPDPDDSKWVRIQ